VGQPNAVIRDFQTDLEQSWVDSEELDLDAIYISCLPNVVSVESVRDVALQRQGVDKIVTLGNGKKLYFDEKIRQEDYGDICLEEYSDYDRRVVGWLSQSKITDYIVYVIKPTRKVYFLPFYLLQRAWLKNYHQWLWTYKRRFSPNKRYRTSFIAVPIDVLFNAILAIEMI